VAVFPSTPVPDAGYAEWDEFATDISDGYASGVAYARMRREFGLFHATLTYSTKLHTDLETLYAFFLARRGRYDPFTFFSFTGHDNATVGVRWPELYVGTHDGTTTTWDLPIKTSTSRTLYRAGAAMTGGGVDYTFGSATGADGRDRVTGLAGTAGDIITLDAVGLRAARMAFVVDSMRFENFHALLTTTGLELIERPAL
jgi:hypothetical protein